MIGAPMSHRSPARYLAPLALVAFALALVVVLGSSGSDGSSAGGSDAATKTTSTDGATSKAKTNGQATTTPGASKPAASYTIKPGDTLSAIAEKTGVAVDTLLALNPDIDPQALTTGQRLKLKQ
jgi:LysM repeat protein